MATKKTAAEKRAEAKAAAAAADEARAALQAQADKNTPAWILALRKELDPADVARAREQVFADRGIKLSKPKGGSRARGR